MRINLVGGIVVALWCVGCAAFATEDDEPHGFTPVMGASGSAGSSTQEPQADPVDLGAACNETRSVDPASETMLVRDPEVLKDFTLERVLAQIIDTGEIPYTPLELLQRLFDTNNSLADSVFADATHCDDWLPSTGDASGSNCTRAEGRLARSPHLLEAGDPDSFVPVALVNRFDLTPQDFSTCGEYRIVFAKLSGRSDPNDRAFLIFEGTQENRGGDPKACRAGAELWASLPALPSAAARAEQLQQFFFAGDASLGPVVAAKNYGLSGSCGYIKTCGQVQLGQGMQAPWEFRQFRTSKGLRNNEVMSLAPSWDSGALRPSMFDGADTGATTVATLLAEEATNLMKPPEMLRTRGFFGFEAVVSALEGKDMPNYQTRWLRNPQREALETQLASAIIQTDQSACPPADPIDVAALIARATAVSCAGCHAPDRILPEGRALGCGQTWPQGSGETHIDEQGQISDALTNVFLPRRAEVFASYLQACDYEAVKANLSPVPVPVMR